MGKKSQRKEKWKKWGKRRPDEVLSGGPLRIERYGRFIRFSNISTPKQHADFLKRSEEAHKKIIEGLEKDVPELQQLVGQYDPVRLMHRAAYMLLPLFMKYRSENEFGVDESHYLPTVEYLQYLIARTPSKADGKEPSEKEWEELWGKAMAVIRLTGSYILTRRTLSEPPSEIDELRFRLDYQRLLIRVQRYPFFFVDHLQSALLPYEQWIKEIYGVSTADIIAGLIKINDYQKTGVLGRYREVIDAQGAFAKKLKEKGYTTEPGASAAEIARTRKAMESDEFKDMHHDLQEKVRLTFTPAIFDITDLTTLPKSFLSSLSVKPGEAVLTTLTGPDHDDLSPLSTSVLHYKPFLETEGRFYTFYHSGFEDHITEIIESDLFVKYQDKIPVMAKRRSDRIEADSRDLLVSIIKSDFVFMNLYYPNPDAMGGLTELDIMLGVDDILFLVEVKAGGFSEGAVRGAPKEVEKKLSDLIIEGQHQSERAEKYIKSAAEVPFFDRSGGNVVHKIQCSRFRKIFRIIITREQLGWVGARIAALSILDPNLSKSFPWHISIDDLRVFTELFKGDELRFVHFLEQRLIASAETTLGQADEIEHLGLYNKINHYHDLPVKGMNRMTFDASYMRDIDHYFMGKAAGGSPPTPTQAMPKKMREFINALRDSSIAGRFEAASVALSMDEDARNKFTSGLDVLDTGRTEGRQRSFRMPFQDSPVGLSVTYTKDGNWDEELLRSAVQMEQSKCERWMVVQMADRPVYDITRIKVILPGEFSEEKLAPARNYLEEHIKRAIYTDKPGRNDPCPCGSGKKFKRCHGS